MVSIRDVARHAGVSIGTVSNVINHREMVATPTRVRVLAAIRDLGFVRNETARQLKAGRSRVMAVLVLNLANPFFVDVVRGAEQAAQAAGLVVTLCNSAQDPAREAKYLSLFAEQRVCGVLITPAHADGDNVALFRRYGIPYVQVDRKAAADDGCSVSMDDVAGGELVVRRLIEAGHTELAYVTGPLTLAQCRDRRTGALRALAAAGLPASALRVLEVEQMTVTSGRAVGNRLLDTMPRPTAVFCVNDLVALGVLQSVLGAGVRVPQDLSIVGYDDIEFAADAAVPLTSVRQPAVQMGRLAAELLIAETTGVTTEHRHRQVVLQPELMLRASSRAIPGLVRFAS
jgi:LacI family transcriptional regulator